MDLPGLPACRKHAVCVCCYPRTASTLIRRTLAADLPLARRRVKEAVVRVLATVILQHRPTFVLRRHNVHAVAVASRMPANLKRRVSELHRSS